MTSEHLESLSELSTEQHALLMLWMKKKARARATEGIPCAPRTGQLPLSFAQERLWFIDQLEPFAPTYNISSGVQLSGKLHLAALAQCLVELVRRHEVLRTSFVETDGEGTQQIADTAELELPIVDLRGLEASRQRQQTERFIREEARRPFNLRQAPLLRVKLLRVTDEQHQFLFTMHHIVSDGWSMKIVIDELVSLYQAFRSGQQSPLPELKIQYADFSVWQRGWLEGGVLNHQLNYWRHQLAGAPEVLNLPADRPRAAVATSSGGTQFFSLSTGISEAVERLSSRQSLTVFTVVLAAFKTLLYRYTGEEDILIGTPVAGRNQLEIEPLIGFFVNTLVLRTRFSADLTFNQLLQQMREMVLQAHTNQDAPFERLVQELAPVRSLNHAPLFQVMMSLENRPAPAKDIPGLKLGPLPGDSSWTSKFDLTLTFQKDDGRLSGIVEYSRDLFEATRVRRLAGHLERLLGGALEDPDQTLWSLPLLTEAEQYQVLAAWNESYEHNPQPERIERLFETQVGKTPNAIALWCQGKQLTYDEANRRANQLAHYLQQRGVGPDSLVGVFMDRSLDLMVGLLGILKAGGAYIPLDPTYPRGRLEYMIRDSQVSVLLTQEHLVASLLAYQLENEVMIISLDGAAEARQIGKQPNWNLASAPGSDHLAYVIYTSGSNGRPKGVMIQQRSLVNYARHAAAELGLGADDRILQFASISFDTAAEEIFPCLLTGSTLVLRTEGMLESVEVFLDLCRQWEPTVLDLPTSYWHEVTSQIVAERVKLPEALRVVVIGGEQALASRLALWREWVGNKVRLLNTYGPTEATVVATSWESNHDLEMDPLQVPIGRPINNVHAYVLDRNLQPVPVGVPGELYIGGIGLARGYLNQPLLTADRFIPNPFSNHPGARLYRTGDLTRLRADGAVEYLGRTDDQVKVRGYRIELGEIEAVLAGHPAIAEVIVVAREDEGTKQLIAYHAPKNGSRPSSKELREYLSEKLPQYMMPQGFEWLDELPRLPNGKVNRRQLPEPAREARAEREQAPGTQMEEILVGIWSEVLQVEQVGVAENFFDLGGHSLLAVQVAARVRTALEVELPLRWIFESPTVSGLAQRLNEAWQGEGGVSIPAIEPALRAGPLPLSFAQERLWFIDQLDHGKVVYNMSTAVKLEGTLQPAALEQSLAEVVRRHEVLRTCFVEKDGQPAQVAAATMPLPLRIVNLSGINSDVATTTVIAQETAATFDLTRLPLVRSRLIQLSDREHALVLTFHHIVCDGWSMGLLVKELTTLYNAFSSGEPSPLADLTLQYIDYAAWQRRWLTGAVLDQQLHYWKQQLAGVSESLELPLDSPRPQVRKYRGAVQSSQLSKEVSESLRALSRRSGSSLFMTLLAAFQLLLSRYSGQEDVVVGAPSAGRNFTELEGQIGFFINTLALRTDLSGNPSFLELLARVRKVSLEAFAHQDAPFEKLLEELQPQRDLSRTPLLQVFFNMLNLPKQRLEPPDLRIAPLSQEVGAKFDITVYITDHRDGLLFSFVYDQDLFGAERMVEMMEQFQYLLDQITAAPEKPIAGYSLVSNRSRSILPDATISLPEPVHEPITKRFFAVAEAHSQRAAICTDTHSYNYSELWQRTKEIASFLRKDGVVKGEVIAVTGRPCFSLIASLLGIMTSGAVVVTIDPNLPAERRKTLLGEANAKRLLLIGETENAEHWIPEGVKVIDAAEISQGVTEILPALSPDDPAYIFFTSGTTGTPKAVLGLHKGLAHFLDWQRTTFNVGPGDRCAQLTALSFDVVLRDIFLPLTSGASLHISVSPEAVTSSEILDWLERERISIIHTVPSIIQSWLRQVEGDVSLQSLRYAFVAGEPLIDSLVQRWRSQFPNAGSIVNLYGPTETTLAKCFYVLPEKLSFGVQPVGRPLPQTQALVLNSGGGLCGIGERGEISMRTPFRTRGYLNRSDENEKRFVQNPLVQERDDIIYRTGDLGRYRPDGTLEILGRVDDQIKIRGVRIEPNEITAVLLRHTGVQSGVVVSYRDAEDNYALVAYVVAAVGDQIATELRTFMSSRLPAAMVPAAFVFIDALPLTDNGKLDRRRLPAPEIAKPLSDRIAPRNWIEEVLAGIWSEVLRRDQIGIHDDFFELGGHSLVATQVASRIRQAFHIELPLRRVFECSTVALLAKAIATDKRAQTECPVPEIRPVRRDGPMPLSFAQERLWFLHQLQPDSFAYNITARIDLAGPLNVTSLDQALSEVVRRHEILRTVFPTAEGEPVQIIKPAPQAILAVADLSGLNVAEQTEMAASLSREQDEKPFALASQTALRCALLRLSGEQHALLLGVHHIATDAWSTSIFLGEVENLYESFRGGEQSQLPELEIQYVDFAVWQRGWLQGEVLQTQLDHWRRQLQDTPPMIELPSDRPRPPVQTFHGETATLHVSEELTSRLVALSRKSNATLFMTLMAVFKTLLYRYTGCEDNVVGTGIAERKSMELERMIGLFVNQLAIRTQFSGEQSFTKLLADVCDTALAAYAHQDLPFEKLVAELQPERSLSRTPVFQVMLMMQTAPGFASQLANVKARLQNRTGGGAKFDLTMHAIPTGGELRIILEYNAILFDATRIERMLGHFHSLLEAVTQQADQRLCDLPLLTASERAQLLREWNDTDAQPQRDLCIHQLIEAQAEQTPDRIALEFHSAKLTYYELNRRANQLAHFLKGLSVGADVMVGLCVERSLEMAVAMLGIMKAGGAYVPIDPAYPAERIAWMLDDTAAPILLTQQQVAIRNEFAKREARVVCLDREWERIAQERDDNIATGHRSDLLAYVIYTSGSTGRPKGVAIQHRSAVELVSWAHTIFSPAELKGVVASTSICFDLSVFEFFVPLSSGGTVIVVADALRVASLESTEAITLINTVPSAVAELLSSEGLPKTIHTVNLAGEPLSTSLVQRLYDWGGIRRVFDLYGPSEDTTYSTFALRSALERATIGRPIANTRAYALDKNLQVVPIGVPGELYLGGEGLARGYLNGPALTAARFVPNPFSNSTTGRLYKTGDLVRYLPDGRLEYLGRTDHQIKLRGFRIELGEVESVLRQHPEIKDNIVIVREDEPGDRRLVAYLVTAAGIDISMGDLRTFLRKQLPDYMIPSAFIRLEALPLTSNGKVDRKALPKPDDPTGGPRSHYVAPRAEFERSLVNIWQQLLRVATVGVEDNFFDLGGHSLLLVRVIQEIQRSMNLEISLMEAFEHPTVASLARHLNQKRSEEKVTTTAIENAPGEAEARRRRRMKRQKASAHRSEL
jgi:amino acid adenylation domain-containing protein